VLVFLIDCTNENLKEQYTTLVNELKSFNEETLKKPQVIAISKMDLADDEINKVLKKISFKKGIPVVQISAATGEGLKDLLDVIWKKLSKKP
jgi:GTP-binding protein